MVFVYCFIFYIQISAKMSIIDFTVTIKGLEDQLLGRVIMKEKQELEAERVTLIEDVTANKRKMKELEDNLLHKLTSTQVIIDKFVLISCLPVYPKQVMTWFFKTTHAYLHLL